MSSMRTGIVRVFRGFVRPGAEEDFDAYLESAVPQLLSSTGMQAIDIASTDDQSEYLVLTVWRDKESLQGFAGRDSWQEPRLATEERRMLARATVQHFRKVAGFERMPLLDNPTPNAHPRPGTRVRLDAERGVAYVDDRLVELPPLEFRLLEKFASAPGKVLGPAELARALWAGSNRAHPYDVRRSVYRLRRLLGADVGSNLIRTRPGYGYFLDP
jgi:heme-degrading monooxygenase HmoA